MSGAPSELDAVSAQGELLMELARKIQSLCDELEQVLVMQKMVLASLKSVEDASPAIGTEPDSSLEAPTVETDTAMLRRLRR